MKGEGLDWMLTRRIHSPQNTVETSDGMGRHSFSIH